MTDVTAQQVMSADQAPEFRYYVFTHQPNDDTLQPWLAKQRKQLVRRFTNRKGETVLVIGE